MKCVKFQGKVQRVTNAKAQELIATEGATYTNKTVYKEQHGKGPATTPKASWNQK